MLYWWRYLNKRSKLFKISRILLLPLRQMRIKIKILRQFPKWDVPCQGTRMHQRKSSLQNAYNKWKRDLFLSRQYFSMTLAFLKNVKLSSLWYWFGILQICFYELSIILTFSVNTEAPAFQILLRSDRIISKFFGANITQRQHEISSQENQLHSLCWRFDSTIH